MTNAKHINGLPQLPEDLVAEVHNSISENENHTSKASYGDVYDWLPANDKIQEWCTNNISKDIYWGIQVIHSNLPKHKDIGTITKFNYVITGQQCDTNFYNNEDELIETVILEHEQWYILNTNVTHEVTDVNDVRISITGKITP